ncbi:ATP-binding protein [Chitinophaga sancti]|uniref:ATP-binding protein n=1 Tax=Chitinophaga sancti TaxID=1004 RepID=UPI002A75C0AD|nr:ATP-binding protein [Chitinophaga sancti]WPQ61987.1 ATP-binding protein [Chitinophaga sancti]
MHELARVTLENEMDLILAHKRSMKLAELAGLSLSAQTTFATAVSEVSRNAIDSGKSGCLILSVESDLREKFIVACLKNEQQNNAREGLEHAKKLVNKYKVSTNGPETSIELFYTISPAFRIDIQKLDEWRSLFRNEPSISPYEELKRKNEQLQELSERVKKSEDQYKVLTNSLPLMIFSLDDHGQLLYANYWLLHYTGQNLNSLNNSKWKTIVHEDDYDAFCLLLQNDITRGATTIKIQARLMNKSTSDYLWHQISLSPLNGDKDEPSYRIGFMVDIHAQKTVEETLKDNYELKQAEKKLKDNQHTLEQYIEELNRSNQELQQFAFVASHDLQEPVRKLLFYSDYLLNKYQASFDEKSLHFLNSIQGASRRMRSLIQDLLLFSQINKEQIQFQEVDLNAVATDACQDLEIAIEEKKAALNIHSLPKLYCDERMMRQLFGNIISNSLKYSKDAQAPQVDISYKQENGHIELIFRDNGIGFDEKYLPKMFTLFQRLHTRQTYEGTGLGLAICRKIVEMHQGKIWATSEEGSGATFFVSLPTHPVI